MNAFKEATKRQIRFPSAKGGLDTEQLWQLSLKSLDEIACAIDSKLQGQGKSFLANPDTKVDAEKSDNILRLEVLKLVIEDKQEENKAKLEASNKRAQREFLTELLHKKKNAALESLTEAEIDQRLKELGVG